MSEAEVRIRIVGRWGHITLDRPRALNALSYSMACAIDDALVAWHADEAVIGVLIDGAGERGFCAGGDIRALYELVRAGDGAQASVFFAREYRLNARIARFGKPYVALMDGIVMGGGVGLSAHGSHRIVTERTALAMPEVGIGFIPDIGATWLLGRVAGDLGTHVALTAARLGGADAIALGVADRMVASAGLDDLRRAVLESGSVAEAEAAIEQAAMVPGSGSLQAQSGWIATCYGHDRIEEIMAALAQGGVEARAAAEVIALQSPTSVMLTLRALRAARLYGALEPCLRQEYRVALACLRGHDFVEGVRAAVVDKDRAPRWQPAAFAEVSEAALDGSFAPLGDDDLTFDDF